ncbi:hypothetical protein HXX76_015954 [Chlamydomonas incerta]|uniref:Uncharacterized protein n=1 Tax=Chlamydomonas incerta TaxID=51695 RepID=A0A835SM66_CHLIN|nr:hypothetical protein HXX76_015954 [Chlamydomonas incerta]|eukprot:KAG2422526.1 hypothetical protein HXX76_015954 [Chlamydomonas incerta]
MAHVDNRSKSSNRADWDKLTDDDIRKIAAELHPNEVANSLKPLDKYTAAALHGAYMDIRLSKERSAGSQTLSLAASPWPGAAFVKHWGRRAAWRSLSHARALRLLCLAASSFHAASVEAAIASSGVGLSAAVVEARPQLATWRPASFSCALEAALGLQPGADLADQACGGGHAHVLTWLEAGLPPPPPSTPPAPRAAAACEGGEGQEQAGEQAQQLGTAASGGAAAAAAAAATAASTAAAPAAAAAVPEDTEASPAPEARPAVHIMTMLQAAAKGGHAALLGRLLDPRGLYAPRLSNETEFGAAEWHQVLCAIARGRCPADTLERHCGDGRIPWHVHAGDVHDQQGRSLKSRDFVLLLVAAVSSERDWRAKATAVRRLLLLKLRGGAAAAAAAVLGEWGGVGGDETDEAIFEQLSPAELAGARPRQRHAAIVEGAACEGNVEVLRQQLDSLPPGELAGLTRDLGGLWLEQAAANGHAAMLRLLRERLGPGVLKPTHLILAAHRGGLDDVQALIEALGEGAPLGEEAAEEAEWDEEDDDEEEGAGMGRMDQDEGAEEKTGDEDEGGEDPDWRWGEDDSEEGTDEGEDDSQDGSEGVETEGAGNAAGGGGEAGVGHGLWSVVFNVLARRGADLALLRHLHERRGAAVNLAAVAAGGSVECCEWALAALTRPEPQQQGPPTFLPSRVWELGSRGRLAAAAWLLEQPGLVLTTPARPGAGALLPHPADFLAQHDGGRDVPHVVNCVRLWLHCRAAGVTEAEGAAAATAAAAEGGGGGGSWARLVAYAEAHAGEWLPPHQLAWLKRQAELAAAEP